MNITICNQKPIEDVKRTKIKKRKKWGVFLRCLCGLSLSLRRSWTWSLTAKDEVRKKNLWCKNHYAVCAFSSISCCDWQCKIYIYILWMYILDMWSCFALLWCDAAIGLYIICWLLQCVKLPRSLSDPYFETCAVCTSGWHCCINHNSCSVCLGGFQRSLF